MRSSSARVASIRFYIGWRKTGIWRAGVKRSAGGAAWCIARQRAGGSGSRGAWRRGRAWRRRSTWCCRGRKMANHPSRDELRSELERQKLPRAYIERLLSELDDHFEDLLEERSTSMGA